MKKMQLVQRKCGRLHWRTLYLCLQEIPGSNPGHVAVPLTMHVATKYIQHAIKDFSKH